MKAEGPIDPGGDYDPDDTVVIDDNEPPNFERNERPPQEYRSQQQPKDEHRKATIRKRPSPKR